MITILFSYFLESAICLFLFVATYKVLMSNLTHFTWMRFYLMTSVVLSVVLPLHVVSFPWSSACFSTEPFTGIFETSPVKETPGYSMLTTAAAHSAPTAENTKAILLYCLFIVYLSGLIYKLFLFIKNLGQIIRLTRQNQKIKEGGYWLVFLESELPAFSFFNYIFINKNYKQLSDKDIQVIKDHELVHVKQFHTLDLVVVEISTIVFWFNPLMHYLRRCLAEIHEFIVDEKIAGIGESKKDYARLLMTLAGETRTPNLVVNFAGQHVKNRILMIAKPRTSTKYKLLFFSLVPVTGILMFTFSCNKSPLPISSGGTQNTSPALKDNNFGSWMKPMTLKDYCGVYVPSRKDTILRTMEIRIDSKGLYRLITAEKDPANRVVYLKFEGNNKFSYLDNSERTIEFVIDNKNKIAGCILERWDGTFTLFRQDC